MSTVSGGIGGSVGDNDRQGGDDASLAGDMLPESDASSSESRRTEKASLLIPTGAELFGAAPKEGHFGEKSAWTNFTTADEKAIGRRHLERRAEFRLRSSGARSRTVSLPARSVNSLLSSANTTSAPHSITSRRSKSLRNRHSARPPRTRGGAKKAGSQPWRPLKVSSAMPLLSSPPRPRVIIF